MRIAVTGCAGYLAGQLIPHLLADESVSEVVGIDVSPPKLLPSRMSFLRMDVRNPDLGRHLVDLQVDVAAHLAFILNPIRDVSYMRSINVDGTRNVLEACTSAGIHRVMVTSSASAYGASPDHPARLTEDMPLPDPSGVSFSYAQHKIEQEHVCDEFEDALAIVRARPVAVVGPSMENFIQRLLLQKALIAVRGFNPEMQFLHERDLGLGLSLLVLKARPGAYNIAPADSVRLYDIASILDRPLKLYSPHLLSRMTAMLWRLGRASVPAEYQPFIMYPWTVSVEKMRAEVGFAARWTSVEALRCLTRRFDTLVRSPADQMDAEP
ncbi:MAG: NAD-dependent epimerase/dehydratase family protein [Planctomycetes bacterium]|nr:NAD-dependent epimerase/dehydratase family protein [Planctomycetota bacterium]